MIDCLTCKEQDTCSVFRMMLLHPSLAGEYYKDCKYRCTEVYDGVRCNGKLVFLNNKIEDPNRPVYCCQSCSRIYLPSQL